MWSVANQLKGVLKFPGLGIEIAPGAMFDLDTIGRERSEASGQLRLAIEQGYLKVLRKTIDLDETEVQRMIEERIHSIKESLASELSELYRTSQQLPK